jgi:hypothetical protein
LGNIIVLFNVEVFGGERINRKNLKKRIKQYYWASYKFVHYSNEKVLQAELQQALAKGSST